MPAPSSSRRRTPRQPTRATPLPRFGRRPISYSPPANTKWSADMQRRTFLAHAGALAGSVALGQLGLLAAKAAPANDYKALVCVFLYGGNDANNMIVPLDTAGYANYATTRSYLALPQAQLLPLTVSAGAPVYGLHPALPGLQALWAAGNMAIVANVGTLVQPLNKAQ